ncbi:hypothetical protein CJF25_14485 [Photobacterium phosphoreum]|uniref:LTA synthase family protein n=1 Tax=Photobacterium phosphoreum TaxID=659 RepID=UPI0039F6CE9B|nr:hypothetical protein [Photobacterium phosphoreum]
MHFLTLLDPVKEMTGVTFPILMFLISGIIILTVSRTFLCIWQRNRVSNVRGWKVIFISGLRMDIVSMCYLLILPCLITPLAIGVPYLSQIWLIILPIWITFGLWLLVYMEAATPFFIKEYDVRPNRLFVEYLIYPKEVMSMMWSGYKLELALGLIISLTTVYFGWIFSNYLVQDLQTPNWYWRPVIALSTVALCVLGARSTLGHRAINPSMIAFSHDNLMNDLPLNSSYSVLYAMKLMRKIVDSSTIYPPMKTSDIIHTLQENSQLTAKAFTQPLLPTLAYHQASNTGKRKNIVILLQESLGARFVGGLGGLPLTPNLDKLMQESWNLTRLYATGTRSIRGIEAVTTGFFPTPANAVVKLPKSQNNFYSIAQTLKAENYHTQFIYAGESHFDNMKGFLLGNGFVDIQDLPTFHNPEFIGSWGACDEDLYNKAHEQFSMLTEQNKPFFSLVFTTTNHSPYDYPQGKIEPYNHPSATRENTVKYSDFALGQFIEQAKKSDYWDDTIFVLVADHDSRAYGDQIVPIDCFHIPAVIFGGGVAAHEDNRLASQLDLPPTLLSMAGISANHPMMGHDLTKDVAEHKQRAVMQYHNNFAWLNNNNHAIVFQPNKDIMTFHYDPTSHILIPSELPDDEIKTANAFALWGSLSYKQDFYQWNKIESAQHTMPQQ